MPDVFISYSRKDKDFAEKLVKSFESHNRDVWIDFEDIPFASEWWEEICRGIESSESTIFIISPDSLDSKVCGLEVNYAIKNNKRLIPLLYREAKDKEVPQEISHLNWITFTLPDIFDDSFRKLVETIDTDLDLLRQHTRLLVRAKEWEIKGHSPSLLLRGEELDELDNMLNRPNITDLQRDFLLRSIERNRWIQILTRFEFGFIGGFLGIGFWAFSAFRSDILITPLRLIYTLALGQVFGLFTGGQSVLVENLPLWVEKRASKPVQITLRILGCLILGVLAWSSYHWFLESFDMTPADLNAVVLGGVGLAAGFVIRILYPKIPAWLATLLMAVLTWIPIWFAYNQFVNRGPFVPLIYFDNTPQNPNQEFSVAIPIALLIAIGANARALSQEGRKLIRRFRGRQQTAKLREASSKA
jgi:hypothetical protein